MKGDTLDLFLPLGRRRALRLWRVRGGRVRKPFYVLARWETELLLSKRWGRLFSW